MKTIAIITIAALTGCSTFVDPSANSVDVMQCRKTAHDEAHDNTSWGAVLLIGAPIAHRLKAKETFQACMLSRGYRTAKQ